MIDLCLLETPVFVSKPITQEVKQGDAAVFEVKTDGYPAPKVIWLLNGKPLTPKDGAQIETTPATGESKLTINNVDLQQHAGQVTCKLENSHGTTEETVRLDILAAPLVTSQLPKETEVVTGHDATLKVVVRGSPRPQAQCLFNDQPLDEANVIYDEDKSEYQLTVKQANVGQHEGSYRFVFTNDLGQTESTPCLLTVLEPVKLVRISPNDNSEMLDLKVGEPLEMSFDIDGKESPKVQLTKDGKEVKWTSVDEKRHVYRVDDVKPENQGAYKVVAKNKAATEESSLNVVVTGECCRFSY